MPNQIYRVKISAKSLVGVSGLVFWWVGWWQIFDEFLFGDSLNLADYRYYSLAGLVGLLITQNFLYEAGVNLAYFMPDRVNTFLYKILYLALHYLRFFLSKVFIVVLWIGVYNNLYEFVGTATAAWGFMIIGNIFIAMSGCSPFNLWRITACGDFIVVWEFLTLRDKAIWVLRATGSIFGDIMMWVAVDYLAVNYDDPNQTLFPKMMLVVGGLVMMTVTLTMPSHAGLSDLDLALLGMDVSGPPPPNSPNNPHSHLSCRAKALHALADNMGQLGYLFFWCGIESSMYFFAPHTALADSLYAFAGLIGMLAIGGSAFAPELEYFRVYSEQHTTSEVSVSIGGGTDNRGGQNEMHNESKRCNESAALLISPNSPTSTRSSGLSMQNYPSSGANFADSSILESDRHSNNSHQHAFPIRVIREGESYQAEEADADNT